MKCRDPRLIKIECSAHAFFSTCGPSTCATRAPTAIVAAADVEQGSEHVEVALPHMFHFGADFIAATDFALEVHAPKIAKKNKCFQKIGVFS